MTNEPLIGKITRTFLGIEDHGILTGSLDFDYGGSVQGTSGYMFDHSPHGSDRPVGHALCAGWIRAVLSACGVNEWDDLVGRTVYVYREDGMIVGIGPLPTERGRIVMFKELAESYRTDED